MYYKIAELLIKVYLNEMPLFDLHYIQITTHI